MLFVELIRRPIFYFIHFLCDKDMTTTKPNLNHNTQAPQTDELIKIATLKKPYGIKGWLWLFSETDNHADVFDMKPWWMRTATGFKPLTVTNWRKQGVGLVASFAEVPDRNVAETMNGTTVWVHKDNLPSLDEDEYYWSDLIGLTVINEENEILGVIKEMFETGAHEIISVKATKDSIDAEDRLIPWHKDIVLTIDMDAKTMLVAWGADY